ncbi:hypothetical protein QBC36DRAFT_121348 [Triangularia setosa]|uniref:DNA-directed RNA polymerase III RPC4 n=1 Tax=Triangularia setosa TaxID=2587417 RepID=A0AAN6WAE6_9PEZI|nr:hypothetical protein QBC36DRAFT_121348 [Podospora setosa]
MPPKAAPRGRGRGRGGTARGGSASASASGAVPVADMGDSSAEPTPSEAISDTVTPAPASTSTSAPPRGRSTTATPAPKPGPKFKPKAVRRSSAERDRIARELGQANKAKDEAEERRKSRLAKAIVRGRGRGGFRGGFRGPVAAGPLSGGMTFGGSSGGGRFARADYIKSEGGGLFGSDGRVNADLLHDYVQDYDDENNKQPLMPMGIRRSQPKSKEDADNDGSNKDADGEEDSDEEGLFVNEKERAEKDRLAADQQAGKVKTERGGKDVDMASIPPRFGEADETDYDDMLRVETNKKLNISSGKAEELRRQRHLFAEQLDDRAFIFQFPVRPPLYVVKDDGSLAKSEGDDDVVMLDGQQQDNAPVDPTAEVKEEEVAEEESQQEEPEVVPQAGYLGKLIVRKSGKVEIDWGGYPMDSGTGVAPRHLSTAVLLEMEDAKPGEASRGFAYSLGRVEAVFSSVLRTSDMEPWVVDNQVADNSANR